MLILWLSHANMLPTNGEKEGKLSGQYCSTVCEGNKHMICDILYTVVQ